MADLTAVKTWTTNEILTASDLNAEFSNVYNNVMSKGTAQTITGRKTFTGGVVVDELLSVAAAAAGDIKIFDIRYDPVSGTSTDGDGMYVSWMGDDDGGNETEYGRQHLEFVDTGAASEDSSWVFSTIAAASLTTSLTLTGVAATFPGTVTTGGNVLSDTDSTDDLGTTGVRWANLFVDDVTITTTATAGTSLVASTLTLAGGSITDSSTAISFGDENLSTTGTLAAGVTTITGALLSNADDGGALGASGTGWSDLFLASGAVIDFNAGDVVLTHSANTLTLTGGSTLVTEAVTLGGATQANSTITVGVDDTGYDVKLFGATAGAFALWDESADLLEIRGATAAGPGHLKLTTGETSTVDGDVLGRIDFQAPVDGSTADAILVAASIWAEADATFSSSVNTTDLVFATGTSETATEKMRINAAGDTLIADGGGLIIGNTSQVTVGSAISEFQLLGTADADTSAIIGYWAADANGGALRFGKSRNATIGGNTIVANSDTLGAIEWYANDGTDLATRGALIRAEVDGTPGSNDMPTRLEFFTTADGASDVTLRASINSGGTVNIAGLTASQDVQTDGSKNLVSVSDARWKNELGEVTGGLAIINRLTPRYFDWKRDANGPVPTFDMVGVDKNKMVRVERPVQPRLAGFFAQEVFDVFPEGSPGGANTDEDGEDHWGLNSRAILAATVSAIQELDAKVEALQN